MKKQIIIVGLDGGTFTLIDEFIEEGSLSFLKFLKENGSHARMLSIDQNTRVPISPTIWTSLATGKRAEKHNIKSFFNLQSDIKSARFFEIFNHYGYSVGNFGWELTWPPEDYGAFNIPCNMARDNRTIPKEASAVQELRKRSRKKASGFLSNLNLFFRLFSLKADFITLVKTALDVSKKSNDKRKKQFMNLMNGSRIHFMVFKNLYKKYNPDAAFYFIPITDSGAHYFWKYYDKKNFPDIDAKKRSAYGSYLKKIYEEVDRQLQEIHKMNEDADLFVISDHGMKPIMEGSFETISLRAKKFLEISELESKVELYHVGLNCVINVRENSPIDSKFLYNYFKNVVITSIKKPFFEIVEMDNTGRIFLKVLQRDKGDYEGKDFSNLQVRMGSTVAAMSELVELNDLERSADHDEWGIFMHYSKNLKSGKNLPDCEIYDFLPTLLKCAALPAADDFDGKSLDIGYKDCTERVPTYDFLVKRNNLREESDDSFVRDELKRLGYMKDE
ncbi:MAG: alkaline phosphatase family protein [bacterium]|nr:alkaline phosphatase family protein [bacterium]